MSAWINGAEPRLGRKMSAPFAKLEIFQVRRLCGSTLRAGNDTDNNSGNHNMTMHKPEGELIRGTGIIPYRRSICQQPILW